ncbi:MAG: hypothetical protein OM95_00255 [Bdellovibrio sp. ArHS]|uniref:O-antigen ligase family protein n=1 Tax=Bdellovibrio sp. ArHS TaxID=1569284 RepID=UPI00058259F3|nr:O-antigen ligase family protein [Bdellovibrio sp. ArHS]KHD89996.1 MAG: hypothetical protein OM95_00255 [Bdellovibrio sp. ArHS]
MMNAIKPAAIKTALEQYFGGHFLQILNAFLMVVVFFSGKFSFARFLDESARVPWLELRIWAILGIFVSMIFLKENRKDLFKMERGVLFFFGTYAVFLTYVFINLFNWGTETHRNDLVYDSLVVIASLILISIQFKDEQGIVRFCKAAELFGGVLFMLCLVGFGNPDLNGSGWAPFGGPITFYRIEFFVFCAAVFLAFKSTKRREQVVHLLFAVVTLYSTFASLSKMATAAAMLAIVYLTYILVSKGDYKKAGLLVLSGVVTFTLFVKTFGTRFVGRINEISNISVEKSASSEVVFIPDNVKLLYRNDLKFEELSVDQKKKMISVGSFFYDNYPNYQEEFAGFLRFVDRYAIIYDGSARLRMWMEAFDLFKAHRWFGGGVGNYSYTELNYYAKGGMETYRYPHNIFFELVSTTGLVGLALFGLCLFVFLVLVSRAVDKFPAFVFLQGYMLFVFLTSMFAGDLFDFKIFWFMGCALISSARSTLSNGGINS